MKSKLRFACGVSLSLILETASGADHYISVDNIPMGGKYVDNYGLIEIDPYSSGNSLANEVVPVDGESVTNLLRTWGITRFPAKFDGVSWNGTPVTVTVEGTLGGIDVVPLWNNDSSSKEVSIFWTGNMSVRVIRPVRARISSRTRSNIVEHCRVAGEWIKNKYTPFEPEPEPHMNLLSLELSDEDRNDIYDLDKEGSIKIVAVSFSRSKGIVLAQCMFRSMAKPEWQGYRGPVIAYDSVKNQIEWSNSMIALDYLRLLLIEEKIYLLASTGCGPCETSGYLMKPFAIKVKRTWPWSSDTYRFPNLEDKIVDDVVWTEAW